MEFTLRPHQVEAIDAAFRYFEECDGHPIWVEPTGAGKSAIIAGFIKEVFARYGESRILVLSHIREILEQDMLALYRVWPQADASLYCAGLGSRDLRGAVVFASIQSIWKRAYELQRCEIVIIDECHLLSPNDGTQYRKFLSDIQAINGGKVKVMGASATPYRLDQGYLTEGDNALFTDICHETEIQTLIDQRYLVPIVTKATEQKFDLSNVHILRGDYNEKELQSVVDKDDLTREVVAEIMRKGFDRQCWLIFCAGVAHAFHVRDEIRRYGLRCETVTGETPKKERKQTIDDARAGRIRAITNDSVLTTGVDIPRLDLVAFLRPSKSVVRYVQSAGRVMRPFPGKDNALCLDFGGLVLEHGPIDAVRVPKKGDPTGEALVKICPKCKSYVPVAKRECQDCGYEFPIPELNIGTTAHDAPILKSQLPLETVTWHDVTGVTYHQHLKPGSPTSLRVEYQCGLRVFKEWVLLEHTAQRSKTIDWWIKRAPRVAPPPRSVFAAMGHVHELKRPKRIATRKQGQYENVVAAEF